MEFNDSKNYSHITECSVRPYPGTDQNFRHLVHETWPRTCVRSVFKFYKKQTKSKNHETYWDVVISYVKAMIKISEDFVHVVMYDAYKTWHLYMWYQISDTWQGTRQRHFKKNKSFPSAVPGALGKVFFLKKRHLKKNLCQVPC